MKQLDVKPGDRVVVVGSEAQEAVGGTQGVVVGTTAASSNHVDDESKVIVAIDERQATNAVIDPTDIVPERDVD